MRPLMLVLPGGGYSMCSDREAEPVALAYTREGYNACVLRYTTKDQAPWPAPLNDYERCVEIIEEHADAQHVDGKTAPCFIVAARDDSTVPVSSSLHFAEALEQNGIAFELHIVNYGQHGFSLANDMLNTNEVSPRLPRWVSDSQQWLGEMMGNLTRTSRSSPLKSTGIRRNISPSSARWGISGSRGPRCRPSCSRSMTPWRRLQKSGAITRLPSSS